MDIVTFTLIAVFMLPLAGVLAALAFWVYAWIREKTLHDYVEDQTKMWEKKFEVLWDNSGRGRPEWLQKEIEKAKDREDYLAAVKAKNEETEYVPLDQVRKNLKKTKAKTDLVQVQNAKSKDYKVIDKATGTVVKSTKKPVKGVKVVTKTRSAIKYASKKKAEESLAKMSKIHANNICALEDR